MVGMVGPVGTVGAAGPGGCGGYGGYGGWERIRTKENIFSLQSSSLDMYTVSGALDRTEMFDSSRRSFSH